MSKDIKKIIAGIKLEKKSPPKKAPAFNPVFKTRDMLSQAHEDGAHGTDMIIGGQNVPEA